MAEYVSEYAKDLVWNRNFDLLDGSQEHQFEILQEQMHRMDRLYGKVDFIVTDAPILLNQIYNVELTQDYKDMLLKLNNQYHNFNYFLNRDIKSFEVEGRLQNLEQSIEKDNEIMQMLKDNGLFFASYSHSSVTKVVPNAIKYYEKQKGYKMARYMKKGKQEWIENAKQMEKDCKERITKIAQNYVVDPSTIADAIAFGSKFYNYSVKNNQLIFSQNPHAQYVQSFPAWKKMGYSPKRGEKGMKIWVPVKTTFLNVSANEWIKLSDATKEQKDAFKQGKLESRVSTLFKLGTVFDIAQTTYPVDDYPKLFSVGYPSSMHEDVCKGLIDYAQNYIHCSVKLQDLSSISLRGFYSKNEKEITLNSSLRGTQLLSTMAHELGHAVRHNIVNNFSTHRKELEADALSIMIESNYGLPLTDARKMHLVSHYKAYCKELEKELGENFIDDAVQDKINEVLSSVFGTYASLVDDLDLCVEKYVSHERLLEYQISNDIDNELSFDKDKEKKLEHSISHEKEHEKSISRDEIVMEQDKNYDMNELELSL